MDGQQHKLRSTNGELRTLAKQAAGRCEEWIADRLEEFHSNIERKYLQVQQDNIALKDEVDKLKEENRQWNQRHIDSVLQQKLAESQHPDFVRAQSQIDQIIGASNSVPVGAVQSPAAPHADVARAQSRIDQIIQQQPVASTSTPAGAVQAHTDPHPELFRTQLEIDRIVQQQPVTSPLVTAGAVQEPTAPLPDLARAQSIIDQIIQQQPNESPSVKVGGVQTPAAALPGLALTQSRIDQSIQQQPIASTSVTAGVVQTPTAPAYVREYPHSDEYASPEQAPWMRDGPSYNGYSYGSYYPQYPLSWYPAAPSEGRTYHGYDSQYAHGYDRRPDYYAYPSHSRDERQYYHYPREPMPPRSPVPPRCDYGSPPLTHDSIVRPQKRRRVLSSGFVRPLPACRLCWVSKTACDGRKKCVACERREADCSYEECKRAEDCGDPMCARLHPHQKQVMMQSAIVPFGAELNVKKEPVVGS